MLLLPFRAGQSKLMLLCPLMPYWLELTQRALLPVLLLLLMVAALWDIAVRNSS